VIPPSRSRPPLFPCRPDDQLISERRVVDDLIPRPGEHLPQSAHVLPDQVKGRALLRVARVKLSGGVACRRLAQHVVSLA
jgi:hypothetical protein